MRNHAAFLQFVLAPIGAGLFLWASIAFAAPLPPPPEPAPAWRPLSAIYMPASRGEWDKAITAAGEDKAASALLRWRRARDETTRLNPTDFDALITEFASWPSFIDIQENIERALFRDPDHDLSLSWFARYPAVSGLGKVRHGQALIALGQTKAGTNALRTGWRDATLTAFETKRLARAFKDILRLADHQKRLDTLLWRRQFNAARAMYPYVSKDWRALAKARTALSRRSGGVDGLIKAVPTSLQSDPGLVYERIRWRRRAGLHDGAKDLLLSMTESRLPDWQAKLVWRERRLQVRETLDAKQPEIAYKLALEHGSIGGSAFAEGEWLSGWIALRFLNKPTLAFQHFTEMWNGVSYPISRGRAAYWAGRAALVLEEADTAQYWFQLAARYHRTFYGQLAMLQLQDAPLIPAPVQFSLDPETETVIRSDIRIQAALIAHLFNWDTQARVIMDHVGAEYMDHPPEHRRALLAAAADLEGRYSQLRLAKRAIQEGGQAFDDVLYPIMSLPNGTHLPADIVHAITRQESMFNSDIVSPAGARGLMQLMPATGRAEAKKQKIRITNADLFNPEINVLLGSGYLEGLITQFDGSYILAIAGYNAGPHRSKRWIKFYGDPRSDDVDIIDWIERIPFTETRNYVQRILENLQIYRAWISGDDQLQLDVDLMRGGTGQQPVIYGTNILAPKDMTQIN